MLLRPLNAADLASCKTRVKAVSMCSRSSTVKFGNETRITSVVGHKYGDDYLTSVRIFLISSMVNGPMASAVRMRAATSPTQILDFGNRTQCCS
jgi:hypothetical protein